MKIVGYKPPPASLGCMGREPLVDKVRCRLGGPCAMSACSGVETAPSLWKQTMPLAPLDFRTIMEATRRVTSPVTYSASGLGALTAEQTQDAKNTLAAAGVLLLLLRGLAGWYVGSKMGRPTSGAVVGGLFGPVGLGVLSFWRK